MFGHPPRSLVEPHLKLSQFIVLSLYCPQAALFQESSILHILDIQRVCSVSLTTDSANLRSLLQEYHRIFLTDVGPQHETFRQTPNGASPSPPASHWLPAPTTCRTHLLNEARQNEGRAPSRVTFGTMTGGLGMRPGGQSKTWRKGLR